MNAIVKQAPPRPGEILTVERARDLLAQAKKVDEVKKIRDQASAIRAYLRQQKASMEAQNDAAEIIIWSQRRLGQLTKTLEKSPGKRTDKPAPKSGAGTAKKQALKAEGIAQQDASRWEKLAEVPEAKIKQHIAGVRARNERLTTSGSIAAVSHAPDHDGDEWGSTEEIVEAAREVLGGIDVDPASNERAQKVVKAKRFFTKKDNGLEHQWKGRVYLNCPYSQPLCSEFVAGFIEEYGAERMIAGIFLLNASTDTEWFHDLAARYPFCLTRGRLAFLDKTGKPGKGNRVGQVIFYAGPDVKKFREVFKKFGTVCARLGG